LLAPAAIALVLLKWILCKLICLSDLFFLDIYEREKKKLPFLLLLVNVSSISGRHKILAVKASALFNLSQLPCWPARLACARYYHSCFVEVDFVQTNVLEQSTSLRYL
jgi:hypothetical protein